MRKLRPIAPIVWMSARFNNYGSCYDHKEYACTRCSIADDQDYDARKDKPRAELEKYVLALAASGKVAPEDLVPEAKKLMQRVRDEAKQ